MKVNARVVSMFICQSEPWPCRHVDVQRVCVECFCSAYLRVVRVDRAGASHAIRFAVIVLEGLAQEPDEGHGIVRAPLVRAHVAAGLVNKLLAVSGVLTTRPEKGRVPDL